MTALSSPASSPAPAPASLLERRLWVAPMMDWTDRHGRALYRLCAPDAVLTTEMIHASALAFGPAARLLAFSAAEHPVVLQLGGSDPAHLAQAARMGWEAGYDGINLNCGCPSPRVTAGRFGACLMGEPALVAACVRAMAAAQPLDVSVKTRLGIDDQDDEAFLWRFIDIVAAAGCRRFVLHARKAWLEGLSPRENREIPPLLPERVWQAKARYPELTILANGGIRDAATARRHLAAVDGVMLGRLAIEEPYGLALVAAELAGTQAPSLRAILQGYTAYAAQRHAEGTPLPTLAHPAIPLVQSLTGARAWRRAVSEGARAPDASPNLFLDAFDRLCAHRPLAA